MQGDLDIENHDALRQFLIRSGRIKANEEVSFRNLADEKSSRVVWMDLIARREAWVFKQSLEIAGTKGSELYDPSRIEYEASGLRYLSTLAPASTPPLIFYNAKFQLLAMQAVPQPHEKWEELLTVGVIEHETARAFGKLLGTIQSASWRQRADLETVLDDRRLFNSLRIAPYYEYATTQMPAAAPFIQELIEEMRTTRLALVHSDYCPQNILIRNGELILLSPQLIHWGDVAFDAGFALAHFTSKAFAGKAHRHVSKGDELLQAALVFWKEYRAQVRTLTWAKGLEARCVRHTLTCLLANTARHEILEYSSKEVRSRQVAFAIAMVKNPPHTVEALTAQMDMQLGA